MRKILSFLFLLAAVAVQGGTLGRHVSVSLRQQHIPVEQAPQYFGQWLKTDDQMTFHLVKDETDALGFRHQRYAQQYCGISVDAATLLVHSRDGVLTHVNGFVMETGGATAPKAMVRRSASSGADVVLVETPEGFVYAVKRYDFLTRDIVYTDVETGRVVKRLPTVFHWKGQTQLKAQSYYYGEREIDVTCLDDKRLILTDSLRKIYTYDAANAPDTIPHQYLNQQIDDGQGGFVRYPDAEQCKKYFDEVLQIGQTRRSTFRMQELTTLTLDVTDAAKQQMGYELFDLYIHTGDVNYRKTVTALDFPMTFDPAKEKTLYDAYNAMRLSDTDTTLVVLALNDNVFDGLQLTGTPDGDEATNVQSVSAKGFMTATGALKPCGHYAVDIHWGMQRIYDYFKTVLQRDSYDGQGGMIVNVYNPRHVNQLVNLIISMPEPNAFANYLSLPRMVYGRGDTHVQSDEQVELSTMGHEFTHLLTWQTANLEGTGEPGGLNEAFSDIFGAAIYHHVLNTTGQVSLDKIYALGQDSERLTEGGCARSLKNPWLKKLPKALQGKHWVDPTDMETDNGGIHMNCTVLGYWFYLLSEGFQPGRDTLDDTVVDPDFLSSVSSTGWQGIGIDKAIRIVYRLLSTYLYPKADYRAVFTLSPVAAKDLGYNEQSTEYQTMMKCWRAVSPKGWTTTGICDVRGQKEEGRSDVFDLQGRKIAHGQLSNGQLLNGQIPSGLYIVNGKKVVIR